jgi:hypothetical protein
MSGVDMTSVLNELRAVAGNDAERSRAIEAWIDNHVLDVKFVASLNPRGMVGDSADLIRRNYDRAAISAICAKIGKLGHSSLEVTATERHERREHGITIIVGKK